ncbi:MAG: hypothetical protein V4712_17660 [Pseudomonadota bacterium]
MTSDAPDDWLSNPAPPPRAVGAPAHKPAKARAKAKPAPKPKGATVTALRPLAALAAQLDEPPIAAGPAPASSRPGEGLDPPDPKPAEPPARGGKPPRPHGQMWDGCPVIALGVQGKVQYLLDVHGQLRPETKLDAQTIMTLFGNLQHQLHHRYPVFARGAKKPTKGRFEATAASGDIIAACADKGLFDPVGSVRSVGAWIDDDDQLIYHTGDALIMGGETRDLTLHQGKIYAAAPVIPHPALAGKHRDPVQSILDDYDTWQWTRPEIDSRLVLGINGVQMLGGALHWRNNVWVSGGPGSGKSELQRAIMQLHGGDKGVIKAENATAASIANFIGHRTLPVMLDELEPDDAGSAKEKQIVELMRIASSGGRRIRSAPDQSVSETVIQSSFMASSVLIPGVLKSQDFQRLIILSLGKLPEGSRPPPTRADTWRSRGAALKRQLIDRWPTWAERLDLWREAFAVHGITGRNADNWATVMAMACMASNEALPTGDELAGWTAKVAKYIKADLAELGGDQDELLTHLLSQPIDIYRRGQKFSVAQWVMAAGGLKDGPRNLLDGSSYSDPEDYCKAVNAKLGEIGLRVYGKGTDAQLFLMNKEIQPLLDLFDKTRWAKGVWKQSAARIPGATCPDQPMTLCGQRSRGWMIPFQAMPGLFGMPADGSEALAIPRAQTLSSAPEEWA